MRHSVQIGAQAHPFFLAFYRPASENVCAAFGVLLIVDTRNLKVALVISLPLVLVPARPRVHKDHEAEQQGCDERDRAERDAKADDAE